MFQTLIPMRTLRWMAVLACGLWTAQGSAQEANALKTELDKRSYAIGADLARNLMRQGVQVETEKLLNGMGDVLAGRKLLMTDDEVRDTLRSFQVEVKKTRLEARGGSGAVMVANREKGTAFLAENKTKEGVVTLPSGLQYKILKAGTGRKPSPTDTVECQHRTMFIDGNEYNSTYRAGTTATLKVNEAVAAWKEALPLMPVGSKWRLFIPSELAYGEKGVVDSRGRVKIEPNTTLICELELVAIK
jgi:FKBP-type peptidyl-prolyl cis-trans isomerase